MGARRAQRTLESCRGGRGAKISSHVDRRQLRLLTRVDQVTDMHLGPDPCLFFDAVVSHIAREGKSEVWTPEVRDVVPSSLVKSTAHQRVHDTEG